MPWPARRVPDEVVASARRRLRALAQPTVRPEVALPQTQDRWPEREDPELEEGRAVAPSGPTRPSLGALVERVPVTVRDGRLGISRAAAAGVALLAAAALVLAGSYAWRARAVDAVVPVVPSAAVDPSAGLGTSLGPMQQPIGATSASPAGEIVVDVAGKVRSPGVVTLPLGSRVIDAIEAAGGVRGAVDLTSLNLARVLADGEQVLVGVQAAAAPAGASGTAEGAAGGGLLDLNSATLDQLETLPGVGPVLGQRIIDWRTEHGRFSSIDELLEVSGIAEARFADLAPRVRV